MIAPDASLLSVFYTIVVQGSLSRAAVKLNISQPALSMKVAQLEQQLGLKLLDRSATGVKPTHFGTVLFHYAQTVENTRRRAADDLGARRQGIQGKLLIGASPIALVSLIPEALGRLSLETAKLSASIFEKPDKEMNAMLLTHEIDVVVGIVGLQMPAEGLQEVKLRQDRLCITFKPDRKLDNLDAVSLLHANEHLWAMALPGSLFQKQVEATFIACGAPIPINAVRCDSLLAVQRLCMTAGFLGILPERAVQAEVNAKVLSAVPIAGDAAIRWIGYRIRQDEHMLPLTLRFIELLKDAALDAVDA